MSGISKKAEARRNQLLEELEKRWAQGKPCGGVRVSPLNRPPNVKPEFLRRGKRMNTTPSRYLAAKFSDFQALRRAVEIEPPPPPPDKDMDDECHTRSTAVELEPDAAHHHQLEVKHSKWLNEEGALDWDAAERDMKDQDGSKSNLVGRSRRRAFTVHVNQKDAGLSSVIEPRPERPNHQ